MKYHFTVNKEDGGYWGKCLEIDSCLSQGDTIQELRENFKEALDLTLEEPAGSNMVFPMPDPKHEGVEGVVSILVDSDIAFALLVRQYRIAHKLTQKQVQEAMGLPNRTSYVRLESKGNPTLAILTKLKKAFPDFPLEECFSA